MVRLDYSRQLHFEQGSTCKRFSKWQQAAARNALVSRTASKSSFPAQRQCHAVPLTTPSRLMNLLWLCRGFQATFHVPWQQVTARRLLMSWSALRQ